MWITENRETVACEKPEIFVDKSRLWSTSHRIKHRDNKTPSTADGLANVDNLSRTESPTVARQASEPDGPSEQGPSLEMPRPDDPKKLSQPSRSCDT